MGMSYNMAKRIVSKIRLNFAFALYKIILTENRKIQYNIFCLAKIPRYQGHCETEKSDLNTCVFLNASLPPSTLKILYKGMFKE